MRLYYTAGSESSLTPVAQSVSLTASSSPVQVGTEVTLTASLNDRATGLNDTDVTYKFEQTSGATVTGTPNGNTYKFTPATADDYTFKVTASAANYSSVTNTVKVTATSDSSDKYAIHVKLADNVSSYSFHFGHMELQIILMHMAIITGILRKLLLLMTMNGMIIHS